MKKQLLFLTLLFGLNVGAQILQAENFDGLPVGAVGTDATGTVATNGYFTLSTNYDLDPAAATTATNAGPGNFQIADLGGEHGHVLEIEGTNGNLGRRNMWQEGLADQWAFRDPANNKIQVEFDLYTGTGGGDSNNTKGLYIYDATTTSAALKILGGFVFNTKTRILQGIAYYTSATAPVANYGFFLGTAGTNLTLPADQWVRLIVSFNKETGQVVWKGPAFVGQVFGAAAGTDPDKIAFVSRSGSAAAAGTTPAIVNAAATTAGFFDNLLATATNVDLLSVEDIEFNGSTATAYPNPANDIINIANPNNEVVKAVTLTDTNGRFIKKIQSNATAELRIDITDLASGLYLVKIDTDSGSAIQKIIKN